MKLQKIMLDAHFTCPNRDGRIGTGGCTFCRTDSFSPAYCRNNESCPLSIREQLLAGKRFFAGKYPAMQYLAYFQAFTNTYAPIDVLMARYEEALAVDGVVGIVIGTRPDCISSELLSYLSSLIARGKQVVIEIGVESFYDATLLRINRGHDAECSRQAIQRCAESGIPVCAHLIFGLPGETSDMILAQAQQLNALPISSLKIHQLQILRDTPMAQDWSLHPHDFLPLDIDSYTQLVAQFISQLRPDIHIERFASAAPPHLVIHPRWGLKPSEVQRLIDSRLKQA